MSDVTVVITNFQRPQFLWEAFTSCVNAGVENIVVSSSGATLEVDAVHAKIKQKRPNTIIVCEAGDSGCNANWLAGVRSATTKWVTILHDDDLLLPDFSKLEHHLKSNAGFYLWDARRHGMGFNDIYPTFDLPTGVYKSAMLFRNLMIPDSFTLSPTIGCFRRDDLISILEECANCFGPEFHTKPTMMVGNDLMIWLRSIQKHALCGYIKAPFTSYGHHPGSATCDEVFQRRGVLGPIYNRTRQHFTKSYRRIIHLSPWFVHADDDSARRNEFARVSWIRLYDSGFYEHRHNVKGQRDSRTIGDSRGTPFLKDVLEIGQSLAASNDIILFTNNDTVLHADTTWAILDMMREEQACCAFRQSYTKGHPDQVTSPHDSGRDLFAFTPAWLQGNWGYIPDYVLGSSDWDSTLATLMRMSKGIPVTEQTWLQRDERCELPIGFVFHEAHNAHWTTPHNREHLAGNVHNRKLSLDWIKKHGVGWVI
jgi:glycosyltransferase involved in cell wall biosynthesis